MHASSVQDTAVEAEEVRFIRVYGLAVLGIRVLIELEC